MRTAIVLPTMALVAALALIFVAFGGIQAQTTPPTAGPALPGLEGIPPEQLFDHFTGAEIYMTDADGNPLTYVVTPGVVNSLQGNTITMTPHGQTTTRSFNIAPSTIVHAMPGPGSTQALVPGDHIVILTRSDSADALVIVGKRLVGMMGYPHRMFRMMQR